MGGQCAARQWEDGRGERVWAFGAALSPSEKEALIQATGFGSVKFWLKSFFPR